MSDLAQTLRFSALRPEQVGASRLDREVAQRSAMAARRSEGLRRLQFTALQSAVDTVGAGRAAHGLERRSPLADRRLLEFCSTA